MGVPIGKDCSARLLQIRQARENPAVRFLLCSISKHTPRERLTASLLATQHGAHGVEGNRPVHGKRHAGRGLEGMAVDDLEGQRQFPVGATQLLAHQCMQALAPALAAQPADSEVATAQVPQQ